LPWTKRWFEYTSTSINIRMNIDAYRGHFFWYSFHTRTIYFSSSFKNSNFFFGTENDKMTGHCVFLIRNGTITFCNDSLQLENDSGHFQRKKIIIISIYIPMRSLVNLSEFFFFFLILLIMECKAFLEVE